MFPPRSRMPPLSEAERGEVVRGSLLYGRYEKAIDRESAFEILGGRAEKRRQEAEELERRQAQLQAEARRPEPTYYEPGYHPSRRGTAAPRRPSRCWCPWGAARSPAWAPVSGGSWCAG